MRGFVNVSERSISRITKKTARIYDQADNEGLKQSESFAKVEQYRNRLQGWHWELLGGFSGTKQKCLLEVVKHRLCLHTTELMLKQSDPRSGIIIETHKIKK